MDEEDAEGEDAAIRSVPLADLFLALGASFLFALFLAKPELQLTRAAPADPLAALMDGAVTLGGAEPLVVLAGPEGARLAEGHAAPTPLAALRPGAQIIEAIRAGVASGRTALVAIEPGGEEAAFLLDPLLAGTLAGPVGQLRLDASCGFRRGAPRAGADCLAALGGG
jgi:hypothetical protein